MLDSGVTGFGSKQRRNVCDYPAELFLRTFLPQREERRERRGVAHLTPQGSNGPIPASVLQKEIRQNPPDASCSCVFRRAYAVEHRPR